MCVLVRRRGHDDRPEGELHALDRPGFQIFETGVAPDGRTAAGGLTSGQTPAPHRRRLDVHRDVPWKKSPAGFSVSHRPSVTGAFHLCSDQGGSQEAGLPGTAARSPSPQPVQIARH
ncbi:hypothetical protein [Kitasatospora sp. NPDC093102]|uniref:hypothetical protein n=1 Tax=Kitasatospora sp. NPDC093102 TaxID=3155069 RepID=UPI00342673AB